MAIQEDWFDCAEASSMLEAENCPTSDADGFLAVTLELEKCPGIIVTRYIRYVGPGVLEEKLPHTKKTITLQEWKKQYLAEEGRNGWKSALSYYSDAAGNRRDKNLEKLMGKLFYQVKNERVLGEIAQDVQNMLDQKIWEREKILKVLTEVVQHPPAQWVAINHGFAACLGWQHLFSKETRPTEWDRKQMLRITSSFEEVTPATFRSIRRTAKPVLNRVLEPIEWNWAHAIQPHGLALVRPAAEIKKAHRSFRKHHNFRNVRRFRRNTLIDLASYLSDYFGANPTSSQRRTLTNILADAETWHRNHTYWHSYLDEPEDFDLAQPPIPLPEQKNIRFLATAKDLKEEGNSMSHCVAGYRHRAKDGKCYLFHVDYRKESATVEVNSAGEVVQAYGPYNERNRACTWGETILSAWGQAFPIPEGFEPADFSAPLL